MLVLSDPGLGAQADLRNKGKWKGEEQGSIGHWQGAVAQPAATGPLMYNAVHCTACTGTVQVRVLCGTSFEGLFRPVQSPGLEPMQLLLSFLAGFAATSAIP